ncbi:hypothetical protein PA08_2702 [Cutibacterium modestum P08]|nr:hypothetical protein PA08_2702 [Cutibacterium modestum P08]
MWLRVRGCIGWFSVVWRLWGGLGWWLFGSVATEDGSDRSSTPDYHVWGR